MNGRKRRGSEPGNRGGRRRAHRSDASAQLKAVRTGVGAALQTDLSDVLREPLPEEMVELLTQLRQPPED